MKKRMTLFSCLMLSVPGILILTETGFGQAPPLWGEIKPGPYAVGFRTIEKYDYSRTFQPAKDYFGNPVDGQTARPIQVCYWYPAEPNSGARMVYSEYAFPYPSEPGFFELLGQLQNRELGTLFFFLGNNPGLVQDLMDLEMLAVRDAPPASGPFPLIVYHGGERSAYSQNAVLCEYLASQGFVVATVHSVGLSATNPTMSQSDVEAVMRDKEMIVAFMRELRNVDTERLGLLGYDYGGSTALLHQMRNYSVDGVATLHGRFLSAEGFDSLSANAGYVPLRMSVPWLEIHGTVGPATDMRSIDSLRYSSRYSLGVNGIPSNYFSTYGLMAVMLRADTTRTLVQASRTQSAVYVYLHKFFDACLNGNDASRAWLKNTPEQNGFAAGLLSLSEREAEPAPPTRTQAEFEGILQIYGVEKAAQLVERFDLLNPANPILTDARFTQLGYQFLQQGNVASALVVFRWGVTAYPQSANAWDSYGDALSANNDLDSALACFRKAMVVLPNDSTISAQMRGALMTGTPPKITQMEQMIAESARGADSARTGN
ncbi:MAG: dienelactone hydrolase family protein [candidate division Zixibacteria bacterium]|nr:dienelactone hydrolase family protein [candidate division Zixibacteria bacterium]